MSPVSSDAAAQGLTGGLEGGFDGGGLFEGGGLSPPPPQAINKANPSEDSTTRTLRIRYDSGTTLAGSMPQAVPPLT
jgi:hypothetical protein